MSLVDTTRPDIRHLKAQSDATRLSQIIDTFANIVELVGDDAACFFALGLVMNDLTNLARPKDPAKMLKDLNNFFLSIDCEGPMASAGPISVDTPTPPTPKGAA